ncbi:MAG TPA: hypothetical protein ENJ61_00300 [Aquifex aeolicus]|uniref:TraG P-loop domain-containing protein n=1 Tax=Aquifex aeolicus TaxID=63363 RepID=A0A7C5L5V4_AQUAO|nr:hypothetical protein [Aquifex aeolicus]
MKVSEWKKLFERANVVDFLPWFQYEDGVYFLRDGGMGGIFECDLLIGTNKNAYSALQDMLKGIPEGYTVQFIFLASPDISEELTYFKYIKKGAIGQLESEVIESYTGFLKDHTLREISDAFPVPVRDYRLLIAVKQGGKSRVHGVLEGFWKKFIGKSEEEIADLNVRYDEIRKVLLRVESQLRSAGFNPRVCEPSRLIFILYPFFHMGRDYEDKPAWDGSDVADCLVENDFKMEVHEDYVLIDGVYGKSLCVKGYPEKWSSAESYFYRGNPITGAGISCPYILALNAVKLPESEKSNIKRNAAIVLSQRLPYALFPRLRLKHEDLTYAMEIIENKGEDVWYVNLSLFVFGRDEKSLEDGTADAKKYFNTLGFRLEEDKYINHAVFLSNMPLGYDLKTHKFLGRGRALFTFNVADLAPVYGDPKVFGKPELLFIAPSGQLTGFDLFSAGQGGYNGFMVATTGAGKSVFLEYVSLMYYLGGRKVRIIDIGGSYERFCRNFGGTYISVSYERPMSVNPFSLVENEEMLNEYMEFLVSLLLLMGGSKDPQTFAQQEKVLRSYLEQAIREVYSERGKETNIDAVVNFLRSFEDAGDPRVRDFVVAMRPYTSEGSYGVFFNRPSEVDLSNPIVVIDNTYIEGMPELMDPLLMVFTFHVSREVYTSKKKEGLVCIIDEAHKFLGKPKIDVFVEQAYRRFRKDGASIIMATQGFNDFMGEHALSKAGRAAVENSFWQFFMMQNSASRNALKREKSIDLSEFEEKLMDSTRTVKGHYSEIFIKTELFSVKVRLVLDSFLKAMFFTDPQVRRRIHELVDSGMSYMEAVKRLEEEMKV